MVILTVSGKRGFKSTRSKVLLFFFLNPTKKDVVSKGTSVLSYSVLHNLTRNHKKVIRRGRCLTREVVKGGRLSLRHENP